jgi:hypothetical protein
LDQLTGEVGDGPEEEEDREATGNGGHKIDATGCGEGIVAKEDNEEATHEDEEGGAGRVGDLEFITAGDEFAAIPEAACGFHGHDIDGTGDDSYDPANNVIHSFEAHMHVFLRVLTGVLVKWAKDAIFGHSGKFLGGVKGVN